MTEDRWNEIYLWAYKWETRIRRTTAYSIDNEFRQAIGLIIELLREGWNEPREVQGNYRQHPLD